jgi:hypothetical protein
MINLHTRTHVYTCINYLDKLLDKVDNFYLKNEKACYFIAKMIINLSLLMVFSIFWLTNVVNF